uniref:F-box domain-containing protein n=1 Tax=Panagrellus redivivus TaxID=6233 RepID=A0A7E4VIE3_PANRE
MSFSSNVNAIKRFTYDWLIRFAELHPVVIPVSYEDKVFYDGSYTSKYAAISPLFTTLVNRHMPYIIYASVALINNYKICQGSTFLSTIKHYEPGAYKKQTVFVSAWCTFAVATSGELSWFKNNRISFNAEDLYIISKNDSENNAELTPDELIYLLKFSSFDNEIEISANLSEPMLFTEIWPMMAHCKTVTLRIKNLIYDENMTTAFRESQVCPQTMQFNWVDIPDKAILEVFDYLVSLPVRPRLFRFFLSQPKQESLGEAITKKYTCAGIPEVYPWQPDGMFNQVECIEDSCVYINFRLSI